MARRFYKNTITFVVLTEDAPIGGDTELKDIVEECTTGDWSGGNYTMTSEAVDGPTMAKLLLDQGSDPEFFQLDAAGQEIEE